MKKEIETAFEEYILIESAARALELVQKRYPKDVELRTVSTRTEALGLSLRSRYLDALIRDAASERPKGRDRGLTRRARVA